GAVPPSSMEERTIVFAACSSKRLPVRVDPVNEILRMAPPSRRGLTTSPAFEVVTRLRTPEGSPASSRIWARQTDDRGVWAAGLNTMVHPAAIAGPTFRAPMARGKFH